MGDKSVKSSEKYGSIKPNAFTLITLQWRTWSADVFQVQINPFLLQNAFHFVKSYIKTNDDEKVKDIT